MSTNVRSSIFSLPIKARSAFETPMTQDSNKVVNNSHGQDYNPKSYVEGFNSYTIMLNVLQQTEKQTD